MAFHDPVSLPLRRMITHPVNQLSRWQRWGRYVFDLMFHCTRQLLDDRAEEMAAALTYRTIFSLIPLLVLGLVVFRVFGNFDAMEKKVLPAMLNFLGVPDVTQGYESVNVQNKPLKQEIKEERRQQTLEKIKKESKKRKAEQEDKAAQAGKASPSQGNPSADTASAAPAPSKSPAQMTATDATSQRGPPPEESAQQQHEDAQVRVSVRKALSDMIAKVANLNFAGIGVVGVVVFIYAAMSLTLAVEYDFNIIFKSRTGRPWHLRVAIYWSIMTLGTGLLAMSIYLSSEFVDWLTAHGVVGLGVAVLSRLTAFLASWTLLFLLYLLVPNTAVKLRPVVIGSLVAAVLWECGKAGFQTYTRYALPYSALYGSLGLIPLFLLWVYISWMLVLFGLELTYALQMMHGRRQLLEERRTESHTMLDPRWLIPVMGFVGQSFEEGRTMTAETLAERVSLPQRAVMTMLDHLEGDGLLHCVAGDPEGAASGYTLARPPERIAVERLLTLGKTLSRHDRTVRHAPGRELLDSLALAEARAADHATVATLLHPTGQSANDDEDSAADKETARG